LAAEHRPLGRVKIIDLLWSDRQEEQARASLRTLLADLREQFGDRFESLLAVDRERVALQGAVHTDLDEPAIGRSGGELFEGLDHIDPELDEWLRVERQKWRETAGRPAQPQGSLPTPTSTGSFRKWAVALSFFIGLAIAAAIGVRGLAWDWRAPRSDERPERLRLARALLDNADSEDALRARNLLLAEVQRRPNDATALGYLAEATMAASDHGAFAGTIPLSDARREGRAYGRRAIQLDPKNPVGWAGLGWSGYATAEAIMPFERAVALDPNNARYRTQLGRALEYQNRYDEAYLHQRHAMRLDPRAPDPLLGLIRVAVQLDRIDELKRAIAAYERLGPKAGDLAYVKGFFAYSTGDEPTCISELKPVVASGDLRPLTVLLSCLTDLGEVGLASELDKRPSLRSEVLKRDVAAIERRALFKASDFWLRNFESLAAADLLVRAGKARSLVTSFDANYSSVRDFTQQGGRMAMEPTALLIAMQGVGRHKEAAELRAVLAQQSSGQKQGMKISTWSLYLRASEAVLDGQPDLAITLLEQCFPDCLVGMYQLDISGTAVFSPLKTHKRFRALIARYRQRINEKRQKIGLPPVPIFVS
jgi:tetratricopeptide (TPR) repeat protein